MKYLFDELRRLPRTTWVALGVAAPLLVAAVGLAVWWTLGRLQPANPAAVQAQVQTQVQDQVQHLRERLAHNPGDTQGWLMLARSLKVTGRASEAASAYEHAGDRARQDPALLTDWIEARVLAEGQHFDPTSLTLLTQAIALAPYHPKVLMLHGLAALDLDDLATARQVFLVLREQHPAGSPERQQLDVALARLARGEDPRQPASPPTR